MDEILEYKRFAQVKLNTSQKSLCPARCYLYVVIRVIALVFEKNIAS